MSHIWTFSRESQSLLQRCLSAAAPPDESNKWLQKFGPRNLDILKKTEDIITLDDSPDTKDSLVQENQEEDATKAIEELLDPDFDILSKFDYFVEKCSKTPKLLSKLAETLPKNIVDKLLHYIFDDDDIKAEFLEHFYGIFLPTYINRDNSRYCSDILLKTYNKYPHYLNLTFKILLKDLNIQNNIMNNFILKLNANDQSEFLITLTNMELTPEEFSHNLFNIHTAYKGCNKTNIIQNYIFTCLKTYSNYCNQDKSYGKLMLAYLQQENSLKRNIISNEIDNLIEIHKSPFKKPCLSVLNVIKMYT